MSDPKVTPMMAQFLKIKEQHADHLLFYRMGDFYELFFDDAVQAAKTLNITLTKRGKHDGQDIPMAGVPYHAAEAYLSRLIKAGFKVAICEQTENPSEAKKRGNKSVVNREVVRVVTAGTLTEETLLEANENSFLLCLSKVNGSVGLAWLEFSTGAFFAQPLGAERIDAVLARLRPKEILLPEPFLQDETLFEVWNEWRGKLSPLPKARFDYDNSYKRLLSCYGVSTLDSFGAFSRAEISAAGSILDYIDLTQKGQKPPLQKLQPVRQGTLMEIDAATRRNLELIEPMNKGTTKNTSSLLGAIDRTLTGAGGRLLTSWISAPLLNKNAINARLDAVSFFIEHSTLRENIQSLLKKSTDLARALSRLSLGRGGPRDLAALQNGLDTAEQIQALLQQHPDLPAWVKTQTNALGYHNPFVSKLKEALLPDLPLLARDGNFIAPGYSPELDETKKLRDQSRRLLAEMEARYRQKTGISSLKIKHNNVLGFFLEISATQAGKIPEGLDELIHRQTLASAVRYTTVELNELQGKINAAADRALALELSYFTLFVEESLAQSDVIQKAASALAALDVACALAQRATEGQWTRPELTEDLSFKIDQGRHPVVELAIEEAFIANTCTLDQDNRIWLLTGPNMAGKSTFLRQNALIAVLAQIGAYVPAQSAKIGIIDRLFSRVGASDDLARGRSTFMVEMVETATILNQATERSFVILDEIGRGTATYDGLSIAWATVEHLSSSNQCRSLFATHYHELTSLEQVLPPLSCHSMQIKEWKEKVIFLHTVGAGAANRSFGIHVASLAGLPTPVILRAKEILSHLEKDQRKNSLLSEQSPLKEVSELPLFSPTRTVEHRPVIASPPPALEALGTLNPDTLSPKEALDYLYHLKGLLDEKKEAV